MTNPQTGINGHNWCFIVTDYNKRKNESKQIAKSIQQKWDEKR